MRNLTRVLTDSKDLNGFSPFSALYTLYLLHTRTCVCGLSPFSRVRLCDTTDCGAPVLYDLQTVFPFTKHVLTHLTHNPPQDRAASWVSPPF